MARKTMKNLLEASRYMFSNRFGPVGAQSGSLIDHDFDNNKGLTWSDAADLTSIEGIRLNSSDEVEVDRQAILGARQVMTFNLALAAAQATQGIFITDRPLVIEEISEIHGVANGATMTAYISKETGTLAPGAGATTMTNTFNMNGTANTLQRATLLAVKANGDPANGIVMANGDRLSLKLSTAPTSLAGVQITIVLAPGFNIQMATYRMNANGSIATQAFYVGLRDVTVQRVKAIWSTAGTDAGAVTYDVTKETGTTAPGSGTSILGAATSLKTTANTVSTPALTGTASLLALTYGDRLSFKLTGTPTALAGLIICVYFTSTHSYVEVGFNLLANGSQADQAIFTADRDYEIAEVVEVHSVAGNDAGAVTLTVGVAKGTTAPGSGTQALTTTFDLKSTANTPVYLGGTTLLHTRLLARGDRIDLNYTGTLTNLAGVNVRIALIPR